MKTIRLFLALCLLCGTTFVLRAETPSTPVERTLPAFSSLRLSGAVEVFLSHGKDRKVLVSGDVANAEINVSEGTLNVVHCVPPVGMGAAGKNSSVRLDITLPCLDAIEASGASDVVLRDEFKGKGFVYRASGASDAELRLDVGRLDIDLSGASDVELLAARADEAVIKASGASDIDFDDTFTARLLSLSVSGSGDVSGRIGVDEARFDLSGASGLSLSGRAAKASYQVGGPADISASALHTACAVVSARGMGTIRLNVSDTIRLDIPHAYDFSYTGGAVVQQGIGIADHPSEVLKNTGVSPSVVPASCRERVNNSASSSSAGLPAFRQINVSGAVELKLVKGTGRHLTLLGNTAQVDTYVKDNTLYIKHSVPRNIFHGEVHRVEAVLTLPSFSGIEASGACEITADGIFTLPSLDVELDGACTLDGEFHVGRFALEAGGASSLTLRGTAEEAAIEVAGAANVSADAFKVGTLDVECAGACSLSLHARRISVEASGANKITCAGNPEVISKDIDFLSIFRTKK